MQGGKGVGTGNVAYKTELIVFHMKSYGITVKLAFDGT